MQDYESLPAAGWTPVSLVEARDLIGELGEEVLVAGRDLLGGVLPIGQEREVDVSGWIGQVVGLDPFDRLFDVRTAGEERRYDHHGPELGRHAARELELAQQPGGEREP